jgi:hypothetical protein
MSEKIGVRRFKRTIESLERNGNWSIEHVYQTDRGAVIRYWPSTDTFDVSGEARAAAVVRQKIDSALTDINKAAVSPLPARRHKAAPRAKQDNASRGRGLGVTFNGSDQEFTRAIDDVGLGGAWWKSKKALTFRAENGVKIVLLRSKALVIFHGLDPARSNVREAFIDAVYGPDDIGPSLLVNGK